VSDEAIYAALPFIVTVVIGGSLWFVIRQRGRERRAAATPDARRWWTDLPLVRRRRGASMDPKTNGHTSRASGKLVE